MKKILVVEKCFDCPHFVHTYHKEDRRRHTYFCRETQLLVGKYPYYGDIPTWCPLPDANSVEQAVEYDRAKCPDLKCSLYPEFCQRDKCTLEKKPPGLSL